MERAVIIDGKEVRMRASALIPRLYRAKFGRDLISDMNQLQKSFERVTKADSTNNTQDEQLSVIDLTIFENIAWLMIRNAGEQIPDSPDEWLDSIEGVFSVYEILPTILELWNINNKTTSVPKNYKGHR